MASIPFGLDRADGVDGRLGTPTPAGARKVQGYGSSEEIVFEELPDSPVIERAEQATITHKFRAAWTDLMTRLKFLYRGRIVTDSFGNQTVILSASVQREKGDAGILTVVEEALSFDAPPDNYSIEPVELGIDIIKHPRYFYAFLGDGMGSETEKINQQVIRRLQDYMSNPSAAYRDALTQELQRSLDNEGTSSTAIPNLWPSGFNNPPSKTSNITGTNMAKRAAMEIIQKYWRGEETPYVVGWRLTWTRYYFRPPYLNPGGYVENPLSQASPQFPAYFYSPDWPPSSDTVFDLIDDVNPQCYSSNGLPSGDVEISWLRKADRHDFERTFIRVTRTWDGAPVGHWDPELYTSYSRPQVPDDYIQVNAPTPS